MSDLETDDVLELMQMQFRDLIQWCDTTIARLKVALEMDPTNTTRGTIEYWKHAKGAFKWGLSHTTKEKLELLLDEKRESSDNIPL